MTASLPLLHFAHANGFHSDCYVPFLAELREWLQQPENL